MKGKVEKVLNERAFKTKNKGKGKDFFPFFFLSKNFKDTKQGGVTRFTQNNSSENEKPRDSDD